MVSFESPRSHQFETLLNTFDFVLSNKISKNKHWKWELQMVIAHNDFELEDGLWLFVKIRRHRWGLSGHLFYLIIFAEDIQGQNP
jgi:hypothetical protein